MLFVMEVLSVGGDVECLTHSRAPTPILTVHTDTPEHQQTYKKHTHALTDVNRDTRWSFFTFRKCTTSLK